MQFKKQQLIFEHSTAATCRICRQKDNQTPLGKERFLNAGQVVYLCENCGFPYLYPDFDDISMSNFYENLYRKLYAIQSTKKHDKSFFEEMGYDFAAKSRLEAYSDRIPENGAILEFGSGFGCFLELICNRRSDVTVYACEPDKESRTLALTQSKPEFRDDISQFNNELDAIFAFHVLEHVKDPVQTMVNFYRALKPGGKVYIEVPDVLAPWGSWNGHIHTAHVSYFSTHSIERLFRRAGYDIVSASPHTDQGWLKGTIAAIAQKPLEPTTEELPPSASATEIAQLKQQFERYRWRKSDSLKSLIKKLVILSFGTNTYGKIQRKRRSRRARRHYD